MNKYLRAVKKNQKRANNIAKQNARGKGLDAHTTTGVAILIDGAHDKSQKAIMTRSGNMGRQGGVLHAYDEDNMPWAGMTPGENYPFINCAEAQAYVEILARHKDPKHFRITSFKPDGSVNPPCGNCSQWVYEGFGEVVDK
ncbi:MAG: hypothetical protein ACYDAH_17320 [Steroidobacteraceae bacterium]